MKISPLRTSAARLALGYGAIFTLGVSALLGTVYFLTTRVIENDADAVISAELEGLTDEYRRDGLSGLADELSFRADSWGQTGAVLPARGRQPGEGGRQSHQLAVRRHPQRPVGPVRPAIAARGRQSAHAPGARQPVTAARWPSAAGRHRCNPAAALRQHLPLRDLVGHRADALAGAIAGYFLSRKLTRRVQSVAATCDAIVGGDLDRRLPMDGSQR